MSSGGTIEIADRAAFPGRIAAIRDAASELRALGDDLERLVDEASKEAASFTIDGPAPVYAEIIDGLRAWHKAARDATTAVCDSASHCAADAEAKFTGINGVNDDAAVEITKT